MSEHTPAPWEIIQLPSFQYRIDAKVGPLHVCPAIANGLPDAYLIAAAPGLLAALKDARAFMCEVMAQRGDGGVSILIKAADAAIARAEGRS